MGIECSALRCSGSLDTTSIQKVCLFGSGSVQHAYVSQELECVPTLAWLFSVVDHKLTRSEQTSV